VAIQFSLREAHFYNLRWIAANDAVGRDVMEDDSTSAYNSSSADLHTGQNDRTMANPYIVGDVHLISVETARVPNRFAQNLVVMVISSNERHISRYEYLAANGQVALDQTMVTELNAVPKFDPLMRRPQSYRHRTSYEAAMFDPGMH
jgi:hypothetical protein